MTVALSRGSAVESVVEIRDVFPTLADVANVDISDWGTGTSAFDNPDGESLIPLLAQPDSQTFWREYIGLEMAECASQLSAGTGMNWNALTDGHMKYIYFFQKGDEMLFDLDVDPYELSNLVADPNYSEALSLWRSRLVTQFEDEGRGDVWILNGELQKISSCSSVKLLPSYPCYPDQCSMA
jgi:arylsulfatase A-like enzyme